MASFSGPFSSGGPQRPRPGYYPPQNPNQAPNLPDAMQNLQIARPPPPSAAPRGSAPPPPGARPAPPSFARPAVPNNGPPAPFPGGPRFPAGPVGSVRAPPPSAAPPPQTQLPRPFPGSPPSGPPFGAPLSQTPPSSGPQPLQQFPGQQQPFSGPPASSPSSAPLASQPKVFSGPPSASSAYGGQLQSFSGPPVTPGGSFGSPPPPTSGAPFGGSVSMLASGAPFGGSMPQPTSGAPFVGSMPQPTSGASFGGSMPRPNSSAPFGGSMPPFGGSMLPPTSGSPFGGSMPPPTSGVPFGLPPPLASGAPFGQPPVQTSGAPYGSSMWPSQPRQLGTMIPGGGLIPGGAQAPPRGMPMVAPNQSLPPVHSPLHGAQVSTPSKIDPNQIPRPMPGSSRLEFQTRKENQVTVPPPASSDFVAEDNGNCNPRLMRCTLNQIPCTGDLLSTSSMPLALMVQPLALLHPEEKAIDVVDFGECGPLRCARCKGYINPFMRFVDQGRRFICNLCGFTDETPRDYVCNLGPDGRRRDADVRPELCKGTVEFVATKEYMVRDPMPAVFFFLIDVSMNAIQTGATAAACSAICQAIADLPESPRTMVGIATFDSAIHFYNLKRVLQQPLMLIVPDIQDVYTPLHTDLIVQLAECRQHLEQLLDNIPTMFENNRVADSAFGAAIKAAFLALKPTGGKLLAFQSVLPSVGVGSLSSREAEGRTNISSGDKEAHKLLQPADKILKTMAIEFAEYQVCVDIFITTQTFVDIASISVVPRTTGGQVYYYYPFSAIADSAKLYNDLRWNISRPQGFEAVMRVRCSQGLQVQEYSGNFCKHIPTDIDLPGIDCDKTIMVTFKHDDKFQEGSECGFQCALLYTTVYGERRIRVSNLSLTCTSMLSSLFRSADLDTQFACFLKQASSGIPASPIPQVREQIMNLCINILHSYRKFCATVSSSGQLILPEALKLLPLYTLALVKSVGLRNDGRLDDRSYWVNRASSLSIILAVPLVYPIMISIHDLNSKEYDGSPFSSTIPLSSEHLNDDGIYLLENGEDALIYVGNMVNPDTLHQLFGLSSADEIPTQLVLQQHDNDLSKKLNDLINEIRQQRCSYLRFRLCRKGDPSGTLFLSYMVEDKSPGGLSYVEFLVHIHRQIQTKMS